MADDLKKGPLSEKEENMNNQEAYSEKAESKNSREAYFSKYGEQGLPAKNKAHWLKRDPGKKHPRRLYSHDYCSIGYYHITATMKSHTHHMSSLPKISLSELKDNSTIYPILSPLGEKIEAELKGISKFHPQLRILQYVIMPDHIHFVLHVKERLKKKLGYELAGFFGACSRHYTELGAFSEITTLFERFHDSVIKDYDQLQKAIQYVRDNPRRAIIKKANPGLFGRYLHLQIGDHEYAAVGNIFLLKHFKLMPVRIHRRWSSEEFDLYHQDCMQKIRNGAIPISPFIHKAEKKIMTETIELGLPLIKLTDCGFEDRFKPSGKDFDLCAAGLLLLLAPWPENIGRRSTSGYTEFHQMNDLALAISTLPATQRLHLKTQTPSAGQ